MMLVCPSVWGGEALYDAAVPLCFHFIVYLNTG
jgi:hypothetical protein